MQAKADERHGQVDGEEVEELDYTVERKLIRMQMGTHEPEFRVFVVLVVVVHSLVFTSFTVDNVETIGVLACCLVVRESRVNE